MPFAATTDGQTVIWAPQPGPQTALLECPIFEVFYGGARGGGKTESSIGDWLQHSSQYGEHAIGIFVRRKLTQLSEVIARTKQIFSKLGGRYNEQQKTWTMPGGGRLKFVYLERDSDAEEYQGHNYTRIYVEEVTNFPLPDPIDKLRATLRSGAGVPVGMRLTGNPGGPGHAWVKKRYIDPAPGGFKVLSEQTELTLDGVTQIVSLERVFIPSKLTDNRLLIENDPTYILRLRQSGSEALVRAWLEGDWSVLDGAYFSEWNPAVHILRADEWLPKLAACRLRFRSMDWGSYRPFSVGWWVVTAAEDGLPVPIGSMIRYAEWYGASAPNKGLKLHAPDVAQGIRLREREQGWTVNYGVCDPSMFIQNGGPSIAEQMSVRGVNWRRGDNKRQPGWEQMRTRLRGEGAGPLLYTLDCCEDSIRTIPILQHDELNSEDLNTEAEDHVADDWRYACMSRPWVSKAVVDPGPGLPKLPGQYTFTELVAGLTAKRLSQEEREALS